MKKIKILILLSGFLLLASCSSVTAEVKGIWVECEGSNSTLNSPQKLKAMVDTAARCGVNNIFLQVYRHNRCWYRSRIGDGAPFNSIWANYHSDPLAYTIRLAHKKGIKVHAWINIFRIGKDKQAPIVKKLGKDIVTCDGSGKSMLRYSQSKLPDGGYWIDPGDLAVQKYQQQIVEEILNGYPDVDGIHLDFIRYPYNTLNPGSQWSQKKDFGYGKRSVERFIVRYGYSPLKMNLKDRFKTQQWDQWRRNQVSQFVASTYKLCKNIRKSVQLTVAAQAWTDRAYMVAYQDWRYWLEKGIVDAVVIMNYSTDRQLVRNITQTVVNLPYKKPVYIGLGAYLMLNKPDLLFLQIKDCQQLRAKGIVLFSYDAMLKSKRMFTEIMKNKWWKSSR